ncbi:uncharacterized protein BDW70DRAFT_166414 [Aspergillus foveolatus]|uniref:uncharacterized protein n=1 Tax=Aspergillus foveolatus TaxID=210207 RepID=UPI003CCDFC9F
MAAPGNPETTEEDQRYPLAELFPPKYDSPCARSVSTILESSTAGSIYDALRATTDNDSETATGDQSDGSPLERVDTKMAASVATFHSVSRAKGRQFGGSAPDPSVCSPDEISRPPRAHLVADKLRTAGEEVKGWSLPDHLSDFHENSESNPTNGPSVAPHSVCTASSPKWPGNIESPVSPTLPEYPPPVRAPTPPGLPTFGSEEARTYDFRIGAQHPVPNRSESLLRRLFQRVPPTPAPSLVDRQPRTRVFAEDGTAVLGSFPQRQSGHGTNILKGTDSHPFHQGNLPLSQCDGAGTGQNDAVSEGPAPPDASPSDDYSTEDEANLRWLENMTRLQAPESSAPPGGMLNSSLLNQGSPPKRVESYQTCVSRVPESTWRFIRQGLSNLSESLYLAPTQSQPVARTDPQRTNTAQTNNLETDPPDLWKLVKKRAKSTLCCCRGSEESGELNPSDAANTDTTMNTTTQETYVTARGQNSNESQQNMPNPASGGPAGP